MILGLHGLPGSGKDTLVERIRPHSKYPVERRAYADKMKESICGLLGISRAQLEIMKRDPDPAIEVWAGDDACREYTMREFIQRFGTEAHRHVFGMDFWLDQCLPLPRVMSVDDIHNNPYAGTLTIVTDVRFPNEAERVQMLGGKIIEVIGPESEGSAHVSDEHIGNEWINYRLRNCTRDDGFRALDGQIQVLLNHLGLLRVKCNETATTSVCS